MTFLWFRHLWSCQWSGITFWMCAPWSFTIICISLHTQKMQLTLVCFEHRKNITKFCLVCYVSCNKYDAGQWKMCEDPDPTHQARKITADFKNGLAWYLQSDKLCQRILDRNHQLWLGSAGCMILSLLKNERHIWHRSELWQTSWPP